MRSSGVADNPTFAIDVDREKASVLGVALSDVDQTFSIAWGSRYVNNFLDTDNRIKKVYVQADAPFRMNPEDLNTLYVRNRKGAMVPFSSFATGHWTYGPPAAPAIQRRGRDGDPGQAAPGKSTGQAMLAMEALAKQLPQGIGFEWTGLSLQQQQAGSQAPYFYALSIIVVFLSLAALYESWSIPISVILVVPIGVLGALGATTLLRPVRTASTSRWRCSPRSGWAPRTPSSSWSSRASCTKRAAPRSTPRSRPRSLRMRPIVMTSMAFLLGVLPLALANGAGSASQNADRHRRDRRDAGRDLHRPFPRAHVLRRDRPAGSEPLDARAGTVLCAEETDMSCADLRPRTAA